MTHEQPALDAAAPHWIKSSYSGGSNGSCVEFARNLGSVVPVRDSKDTTGPVLTFHGTRWTDFVTALTTDDLTT
ncbi:MULTISPECIES: DUF397 domain-containing protein [unclassified Streptomyces]|uniref:DUF397 domain-containing protein n=1 Tax=unclassified Streptomyces TaxID=2593676 RepID=UPI000CD4AD89|nr:MULTISPECIES: DUF397 domain-containing protein [unclassified Streptomyces]